MKIWLAFAIVTLLSPSEGVAQLSNEWQLVSFSKGNIKDGETKSDKAELVAANFDQCPAGASIRFNEHGKFEMKHGSERYEGTYKEVNNRSIDISIRFKEIIVIPGRCQAAVPSIYSFNAMLESSFHYDFKGDTLKISFDTRRIGATMNFLRKKPINY